MTTKITYLEIKFKIIVSILQKNHIFVNTFKLYFMLKLGTVMTPVGKKALLLGSGELGKEVAIELQRFGVEVVAVDKYANAPAMQIAHRN